MKIHILILSFFLICASAFCGDNPGVTIRTTLFAPGPDSAFSIEGKATIAVYQAFRKANPKIFPEANPLSLSFEGAAGEAPLLMSIAGGTAPDVMDVNGRQSGSFIGRNFLLPLDDFINTEITAAEAKKQGIFDKDIMYKDELAKRVLPPVWDAIHREDADGKKHVYILPYDYFFRVLAYNKSLFQKAGLDPNKDYPRNWNEMIQTAKKIQNPDEARYGMLLSDKGGASWAALPLFYSMGSEIVKQNKKTGQWRATFNDPGSLEAADFYLQLVEGPWIDPVSKKKRFGVGRSLDVWYLWRQGQVGMAFLYINNLLINSDPNISALNPEEMGIVPVPKSPIGKSITEMHMRGLAISATTKDPKKIRAAWKFIRFAGSPEAEKVIVKTYVENGYGNFIDPEKLKKYGYEEYVKYVPKQWVDTLRYSRTHCEPEPYGKNCQVYIERASKPLQTAFAENLAHNPDKKQRISRLKVLYDEAVADINEKMLGQIPEEVMSYRRKVTTVIVALITIAFCVLFIYIWKLFTPPAIPGAPKYKHKKYLIAYMMLLPAVAAIFVFNYYPLIRGAFMAFQDYNVIGESKWVGIDNFAAVFFDKIFWISSLRTLEYVFWCMLLVFLPPIILAIILSEIPAGNVFFRVIYYLPAVVSGLVVMIMWKMFFEPTESGSLNQILSLIGIMPKKWLQDPSLAMISIIIPLSWAGMGPGCLIYLAALKTVPGDLYEAAAIDGAGFFRRVRYVALPTIRPLILIQFIFVLIGTFQSADNVLVMTGGGPDYATHVVGLEIFYNAYVYLRFGVAIAIAWVLGFLLVGLTMFQMRRISRMSFSTAGDK